MISKVYGLILNHFLKFKQKKIQFLNKTKKRPSVVLSLSSLKSRMWKDDGR